MIGNSITKGRKTSQGIRSLLCLDPSTFNCRFLDCTAHLSVPPSPPTILLSSLPPQSDLLQNIKFSTLAMATSDLDQLLDMGFEKEKATLAVKKTGGCTYACLIK